MAATKTDKGSRQDMFANSVNSLMTDKKPQVTEEKKAKPKITSEKSNPVVKETVKKAETQKKETPVSEKKKTPGRPKGVEKTQISLYLPNDLLANMECATYFYKGNATAYITALIEKDMENNKEKYDTIRAAMNM